MVELQESGSFHGYTLVRRLGVGGTGVVWLVRHEVLDSFFAVKIIDSEAFASDREAEARFYREAKIAAKIRHPALVRVYDAGCDAATGCFFLVMDYLPGGTVSDRLAKVHRFSVAEATKIVHRAASGLVELHRMGVVHRDVKPANLLFDANGDVSLSDPGIARVSVVGETRLTQEGFALGTPAYMPFEQVVDSHCVDGRADIHALGVTLFELLAGEPPNSGLNAVQVLKLRADGKRIPDVRTLNREVPARLAEFIAKMTEPDVSNRVKSASEVIAEMAEFAFVERPESATETTPAPPTSKKMSWTITAVAAALVVLAGIVAICLLEPKSTSTESTVTPVVTTGPEIRSLGVAAVEDELPRQIVKTVIVSLTNTVVVTNFVRVESKPSVPDAGVVTMSVAKDMVPSQPKIDLRVCGIALRFPADWCKEANWISNVIASTDSEVRELRCLGSVVCIQDAVREIVGAGDAGEYRYDKASKTVEIGREFVNDRAKAVNMVVNFMTSRKDPMPEPVIAGDLSAYVRCKIYEAVSLDSDAEMYNVPIRFAEAVERKYGMLDFEGRRWVGGSYRQIITQDIAAKFRKGKVFMFLRTVETRHPSLLRDYYRAKRDAVRKRQLAQVMTLNDFIALLSVGCGENLFPQAREFGLNVNPRVSPIRVNGLRKPKLP